MVVSCPLVDALEFRAVRGGGETAWGAADRGTNIYFDLYFSGGIRAGNPRVDSGQIGPASGTRQSAVALTGFTPSMPSCSIRCLDGTACPQGAHRRTWLKSSP